MFKDIFARPPALRRRDQADHEARFLNNQDQNLFMGSFGSFEEAAASAPAGKPVGYANAPDAPQMYSHQVCSWDYAPIYWIADAVSHGMTRVFDLGGHVGIKYYAFKRLIAFPRTFQWKVCDVPGVASAGEALAAQRGVSHALSFCSDLRLADGFDLLFLSGSLQYLPLRMTDILATLPRKPRRVLLNITATHPERTLFTLNSIGIAVCPYRVQHQDQILEDIRSSGYDRRDVWRNDGKEIHIPFVEGGDQAYYFGCCFDRS